jgi:hypothetical protein
MIPATDENPFGCTQCEEKFQSQQEIQQNMSIHRDPLIKKEPTEKRKKRRLTSQETEDK